MIAVAQSRPIDHPSTPARRSEGTRWGSPPIPTPETVDLRRSLHREHAELLIARSACLPPDERALIQSVYDAGLTVARVAALRRECPRSLRRRLRRIIGRLLTPRFAYVMRSRDAWPVTRRNIATCIVLHGHSMRKASRMLECSLHTVRKEMQKVDALAETGGRS